MAEQMTSIRLAGLSGWMNYGRKTRAEMIARYREIAYRNKIEAEAILIAADKDFVVEQHTGKCVRRNVVKLT